MTDRNDVQLERGYVRIANRLMEAILAADFTGGQVKVVLALARLTFGWQRKTVTCSHAELAAFASMPYGGGFRRALGELADHGVVLVLERGGPGHASTYAIQKDFSNWGRFSIAPQRLVVVWGERPENADQLMLAPVPEHMPAGPTAPTGSDDMPPQGHTVSPDRDIKAPANPAPLLELVERKDRKDIERQTTPSPPPAREPAQKSDKRQLETSPQLEALYARLESVPNGQGTIEQFLIAMPDTQDPRTWVAAIDGWFEGLSCPGGKPFTVQAIVTGLSDYLLAGGKDFAPVHVRSFVERAQKYIERPFASYRGSGAKPSAADPARKVVNGSRTLTSAD